MHGGPFVFYLYSQTGTKKPDYIVEQLHPSQGVVRARFQRKRLEEGEEELHILPGTQKWESSNPEVARVTPSPDHPHEVLITPGGMDGFTRITFEALLDGDVNDEGQLPVIRASRVVELQSDVAETDGFIVFDQINELASL